MGKRTRARQGTVHRCSYCGSSKHRLERCLLPGAKVLRQLKTKLAGPCRELSSQPTKKFQGSFKCKMKHFNTKEVKKNPFASKGAHKVAARQAYQCSTLTRGHGSKKSWSLNSRIDVSHINTQEKALSCLYDTCLCKFRIVATALQDRIAWSAKTETARLTSVVRACKSGPAASSVGCRHAAPP